MKIGLSDHFTYKKLIKFTLPTIIMMIFTSIYGVVDGLFVSNVAGSTAFAGVNFIMPVVMIVGAIGFMIGSGGSAIISKTLGEGDKKKANEYFSMFIYLVVILAVLISAILIPLVGKIAKLIGADEEMLGYCTVYGRTLLVFMVFFMLQNTFQSFLIVAEKPTFGLIITIIAGLTNMLLDYVFIYVLKLDVLGAALATGISQLIGSMVPLIYFMTKNSSPFRLGKAKFELKAILNACGNGSSELVSNISMSIINVLFNMQLMKYFGQGGVVAYGVIMYVGFIFQGVYFGYSIGVAPIIGYHYGAENIEELKNLFKKSLRILAIFSVVMTGLAELTSPLLAKIFVSYDADLLSLTTLAIRLFCTSYLICAFNMFSSSLFTALGNGAVSAIISFMRTLVFQVIAIFAVPAMFGPNGLWLSVLVSEIFSLVLSATFVLKNKSKYKYA